MKYTYFQNFDFLPNCECGIFTVSGYFTAQLGIISSLGTPFEMT